MELLNNTFLDANLIRNYCRHHHDFLRVEDEINLNENKFLIRRTVIHGKPGAHLFVLEERGNIPRNGPLCQV
jgi:hypothetical protein